MFNLEEWLTELAQESWRLSLEAQDLGAPKLAEYHTGQADAFQRVLDRLRELD